MKRSLLYVFCIVIFSILTTGCTSIITSSFDLLKSTDYEAQKGHVVLLDYIVVKDNKSTKYKGTGFCISETKILTNKHIVKGVGKLQIYLLDGTHLNGNVVAKAKDADLATVEIAGGCIPTTVAQKPVVVGEKVHIIAHPLGVFPWTTHFGHVSSIKRIISVSMQSEPNTVINSEEFFQFDMTIARGTSGGPIFRGNKVVGVMSQFVGNKNDGISNMGFAIPASVICKFIECEDVSE